MWEQHLLWDILYRCESSLFYGIYCVDGGSLFYGIYCIDVEAASFVTIYCIDVEDAAAP